MSQPKQKNNYVPQRSDETVKAVVTLAPSSTQVAAAQASLTQQVVASDVIIPRLLLMQAISPLVTSRKAQIADFIRSTNNEKLGDPEHPVTIIPLAMTNMWMDFEKVPGENQPRFRGMYPRGVITRSRDGQATETNELLDWQFKGKQGEDMFRRKTVILYALIPNDIAGYEAEVKKALEAGEVPDLNQSISPVVITFQSTSFKHGGRKAATFFNTLKQNNAEFAQKGIKRVLAPFDYAMTLKCKEEKKGSAAWYVFDFEASTPLSKVFTDKTECDSIKEKAAFWTQALAAGGVKVDDSAEIDEDSVGGSNSSTHAEMEV